MTLKGGTTGGACAACKYQRRRCTADCKLAPYFPADNPKVFQNVHKLFGVRSIVKMLETIDEDHQPEAMKAIIFEAHARDRSRVHGCLGVTQDLQYQIWHLEEELKVLNSYLQFYRSQHQYSQNHIHNNQQLDLRMGMTTPHMSYISGGFNNNGYSIPPYRTNKGKEILTNNNTNLWGDHQNLYTHHTNKNGEGFSNQNEMKMVSNYQQEKEEEDSHEYDDIQAFLKQPSFTDTKEANAPTSSGQSLKEPNDEIQDNCFSLTRLS